MNKFVELERPAIWKPIRNKDISIRKYAGGYPYMKRGIYGQSDPLRPVIRYAKNYTKYKKDYAIVLFTNETDMQKAEKFMDKVASTSKEDQIKKAVHGATMARMDYIDVYYDKEAN